MLANADFLVFVFFYMKCQSGKIKKNTLKMFGIKPERPIEECQNEGTVPVKFIELGNEVFYLCSECEKKLSQSKEMFEKEGVFI